MKVIGFNYAILTDACAIGEIDIEIDPLIFFPDIIIKMISPEIIDTTSMEEGRIQFSLISYLIRHLAPP
jgi:hypothetical protein